MRLGAYPCTLLRGTKAYEAYAQDLVHERHRHRYEVNNKFKKEFEANGIVFSGVYKDKDLVEISENSKHPFMLGTQFHPEFTSTPLNPQPLFKAFIDAVITRKFKE
jgi:CTP synthase